MEGRKGRISAEFPDADRTAWHKPGTPRPEREGFRAMLAVLAADTREPPLGVAAWHADRLLRSGGDAEDLIAVCAAGRHPVETPRGGSYELWTANGRRRLRDDATAAAYEVDHAVERILEQKAELAAAGGWPGGFRPFGWDLIPAGPDSDRKYDGLALCLPEVVALREGANLVLSGTSLYAVAASWNAQGITTSRGAAWRGDGVRAALLRPWNAGLAIYQGRETGTPTRWAPPETEDGDPGILEPILDIAVFRALQALLTSPSRRIHDGTARVWLGAGVYLCGKPQGSGYCDAPLRSHYSGNGRFTYIHWGHVSRAAVPLDEYVSELVCGLLEKPGAAERVAPLSAPSDDPDRLHARVVTLRERMRSQARLHARGDIDDDQLAEGTAEARSEITSLEAKIAALAAVSPLDGFTGPSVRARWQEMRENGDIGRMQAVIRHLMTVRVIPVGRGRPKGSPAKEKFFRYDKITIDWRVPGGHS